MPADQTLSLPAITVGDLPRVREFLRDALVRIDCGGASDALLLALDEVCANLAEHASANTTGVPVRVTVRGAASDAIIVVEDEGAPFHPDNAPPPDLDSDWESRRVGGLGWFLVRQMVDELHYESLPASHSGSTSQHLNRLTLIKRDARRAPHIADS